MGIFSNYVSQLVAKKLSSKKPKTEEKIESAPQKVMTFQVGEGLDIEQKQKAQSVIQSQIQQQKKTEAPPIEKSKSIFSSLVEKLPEAEVPIKKAITQAFLPAGTKKLADVIPFKEPTYKGGIFGAYVKAAEKVKGFVESGQEEAAKKMIAKGQASTMEQAKQQLILQDAAIGAIGSVEKIGGKVAKEVGKKIVKNIKSEGGKIRGFVQSAKEKIPEATKIAGQYIPRSTDKLSIKAKNLIRDDFAVAEKIALTESNENAVAVASELLKKYADDATKEVDPVKTAALYDKAAEIANTLAPKLTEQGRAIQAASILGRLTPEGQVRFAAREIQRYNELNPFKKISELTGEQIKFVTVEMKIINEMADGTEKAIKFKKLQEYVSGLVPTPTIKKIIAVWKAGLLTGIKTTGLNIFSNTSHAVTEIAKDAPAALVDSVAALFTGQRTKTFTIKGTGKGLKEGFEKGWRFLKTGYDERNIAEKLDYKKVNFGKNKLAKVARFYTEGVFRVMGATDQPFYYGALSRSLMDQAIAQAKNAGKKGKSLVKFVENLVQNPTEEMLRYGVADAATAVFQNKTKLGEVASGIQKLGGGAGEIVLPFGRTPSAVAMQIINYSPIGLTKPIIRLFNKAKNGVFDQRIFSQEVGRVLIGVPLLALGFLLGKKGLVSLDYPLGNEREQELQKAEGVKNNAIKIGGKWRSPMVLGPAGNLLLVGAHFQKTLETSGSPTEALSKAILGGAKSFTENTFLTGLKDAINAVTDPERYAKTYLPNLLASIVPTIISDIKKSTDPKERRAETTIQRLQARIPRARRQLEPQVDILGKERKAVGNPLEIMLDPTRPSPDISTPVTQELRRLMDAGFKVSPTTLGDRKGYEVLSQKENTNLWKLAGGIISDKLASLFSREEYQKLSDYEKGKAVEKIVNQAKINARAGIAIELTEGLIDEALKKKLSELKVGGLLTKDVFKKYIELR